MKPNEGSWLSILTPSRCVYVLSGVSVSEYICGFVDTVQDKDLFKSVFDTMA